jgi:hypothetical protein
MPVAWFIATYKRRYTNAGARFPVRYCCMDDYTSLIRGDGGKWTETEVLGNRAIVKVRASAATLQTINDDLDIRRIPLTLLNDPLSSLSAGERSAIRDELLDAGYTTEEITVRFPNIANASLGDVLRFMASRRRKPRYIPATDIIVCDGEVMTPRPIESVDAEVQ